MQYFRHPMDGNELFLTLSFQQEETFFQAFKLIAPDEQLFLADLIVIFDMEFMLTGMEMDLLQDGLSSFFSFLHRIDLGKDSLGKKHHDQSYTEAYPGI